MYYNIENSFSKLQKTPQPKVEVKKEGNIIEIKRKQRQTIDLKGVANESERKFLELATSDKFILSIGNKGTGKSWTMLHFLKLALEKDWFECYYLVLPAYTHEANDSYDFIKKYSKSKIYIYTEWDTDIILTIVMQDPAEKKLIMCDDSTGS